MKIADIESLIVFNGHRNFLFDHRPHRRGLWDRFGNRA